MSHDDLSRIDKTSVSLSLDPIMTIAEAEWFDGRGSTQLEYVVTISRNSWKIKSYGFTLSLLKF